MKMKTTKKSKKIKIKKNEDQPNYDDKTITQSY